MTDPTKNKETLNKEKFDSLLADLVLDEPNEDRVPMTQLSDEEVLIREQTYQVAINYRDGFNFDEFNRLYQDYFEKYDFIVGDWAHEKLRLRGFYQINYKRAGKDRIIDFLDDYLKEYCNFGCAYFVLGKEKAVQAYPDLLDKYKDNLKLVDDRPRKKSDHKKLKQGGQSQRRRRHKEKKNDDFVIREKNLIDKKDVAKTNVERRQGKHKGAFVIKKKRSKSER